MWSELPFWKLSSSKRSGDERGGQLDAGAQKDESFLSHPSCSNRKYGRTGVQALLLHKHKEEAEGRGATQSQCGDSIIRNLSLAYAPYLQAFHLWLQTSSLLLYQHIHISGRMTGLKGKGQVAAKCVFVQKLSTCVSLAADCNRVMDAGYLGEAGNCSSCCWAHCQPLINIDKQ